MPAGGSSRPHIGTIVSACEIERKWRLSKDTINIAIARDCIEGQGGVRVSLYIGAGNGTSGDPTGWTKTVRVGQG